VQARIHTTPTGVVASYNSSQAVVCAIWLFANIWFVNLMRAKMPALQFPAIMYRYLTSLLVLTRSLVYVSVRLTHDS